MMTFLIRHVAWQWRAHKFIALYDPAQGLTFDGGKVIFIHMDYLVRNWKFNNILLINVGNGRKRHNDRGYTSCITNKTQPKRHVRTHVSAANIVARHLYHHPLVFRHLTDDIDRLHHATNIVSMQCDSVGSWGGGSKSDTQMSQRWRSNRHIELNVGNCLTMDAFEWKGTDRLEYAWHKRPAKKFNKDCSWMYRRY